MRLILPKIFRIWCSAKNWNSNNTNPIPVVSLISHCIIFSHTKCHSLENTLVFYFVARHCMNWVYDWPTVETPPHTACVSSLLFWSFPSRMFVSVSFFNDWGRNRRWGRICSSTWFHPMAAILGSSGHICLICLRTWPCSKVPTWMMHFLSFFLFSISPNVGRFSRSSFAFFPQGFPTCGVVLQVQPQASASWPASVTPKATDCRATSAGAAAAWELAAPPTAPAVCPCGTCRKPSKWCLLVGCVYWQICRLSASASNLPPLLASEGSSSGSTSISTRQAWTSCSGAPPPPLVGYYEPWS